MTTPTYTASTPTPGPPRDPGRHPLVRRILANREFGLLVALIVVIVIFSLTAPNFLTLNNGTNVLRQAAFVGIIALGMTLVIVAAEIDISVGALVALTSAMMGVLTRDAGLPIGVVIVVVIAVGALSGTLVGVLRSVLAIPTIISTLALFLTLRGVAQFITNASPIPIGDPFLAALGSDVLGVPVPVVVFVVVGLISWVVATKTTFGREVYAVGGNAIASRVAGINVSRVRILVFVGTGVLAAITGILQTARIGAGSSSIGLGLEFEVIAAVIIGGTALTGGRGSVFGTVLGVLFVTVLGNALVLYGVSSFVQDIVRGAVVLLAVIISSLQSRAYRVKD